MKFGIRLKFIGILVLAAGVPLLLGLTSVSWLGYRHYEDQRGQLFQSMALHTSSSLGRITQEQIHNLQEWMELTDVVERLAGQKGLREFSVDVEDPEQIEEIERRWPGLAEGDPPLRGILENELAEHFRAYQGLNPLYVEIFVTDGEGELLASTNKTSDYWQANEVWWTQAVAMKPGQMWVEGVHFDESAEVFSLDVAMAIRREGEVMGVIKGVLDITPLMRSLVASHPDGQPDHHVTMGDGRVLTRLFAPSPRPLEERLSTFFLEQAPAGKTGWRLAKLDGESLALVGYAGISLEYEEGHRVDAGGVRPMFVLVHAPFEEVMAPVNQQLLMLGLYGSVVILACGLAGYGIANSKILAPLRVLRAAAGSIADTAQLNGDSLRSDVPGPRNPPDRREADASIVEVERISTGDEIEDLARDFGLMSRRVMNYHAQLEKDLSNKVEEIQSDLVLAREFQESLLPKEYPQVVGSAPRGRMALNFYHYYKPTLSLGGDFFHIEKLTDHHAGIFIADVAGHGARAALVTAILRTLVRDLTGEANDPARFLERMNEEFYGVMPHEDDCIFATAFYLVLDLKNARAAYASAGHPSPLFMDRREGRVELVISPEESGPALGLLEEASYTALERKLEDRDAFLLLTDGLLEAPNPAGEEFGWERLVAWPQEHSQVALSELVTSLMDQVQRHMDTEVSPDDLCLVGVEVQIGGGEGEGWGAGRGGSEEEDRRGL